MQCSLAFPPLLSSPLTLPECCYFVLYLHFPSYLLLSLSIVSHLSSVLLLLCIHPVCLSRFCINPYSCSLFFLSLLLPLLSSSNHWEGSMDRDDFISRATDPCRVISLQDRRDNSSGLVMHTATEYMDINQHTHTHTHSEMARNIFIFSVM